MSGLIGSALFVGLEGLLELVIPKLIEVGVDELEKADLEPIIRSIVPGERLDDFVVRYVKERLPQPVTGIKEHMGEDSIKKIIATIKD